MFYYSLIVLCILQEIVNDYTGVRFRDPNQKLVSDVIFLATNKTAQLRENAKRNQKIVFSLRCVEALTFLKIYGVIQIFAK